MSGWEPRGFERFGLKVARRIYREAHGHGSGQLVPSLVGQDACDEIGRLLRSPLPVMVGRFGSSELLAIRTYLGMTVPRTGLDRAVAFVTERPGPLRWRDDLRVNFATCAGMFPTDDATLERFSKRMLSDMPLLDVLGSSLPGEDVVRSRFPKATIVPLHDLEPYYFARPWTTALAGARVLVIHPFAETIARQYEKRTRLFANEAVLPDFSLRTMKAVQSIAGQKVSFSSWFEALSAMEEEVEGTQFDVAIIGAGAYGFPLAAQVKRMGRKAIQLGGPTQILFGIRGRRWDERPEFVAMYNDDWVRPAPNEVPQNATRVEGGCYW
jgi:hypothetical protein